MKRTFKIFFALFAAVVFTACDKVQELPQNQNGIAAALSASSASVAPAPADSTKTALTINWTYPNYAASDPNSVKYIIDIDSTGKNFTKSYSRVVIGSLSTSFTGKELNAILLAKGYSFNVPADMDIRVTSSYANNNERIASNIVKVKMTPYKIPPKVALPTTGRLFIVGNATQGGWNNPVPVPAQEFTKLNETTFSGVFKLNGGLEYLLLPLNGDWGHKFAVADKSKANLNQGGDFGLDLNDNFPGPATSGLYRITVDFQLGKFTVTPYTGFLPDNLFIVGNATTGGWNNPVPETTQKFTRVNSSLFELTLPLIGSKEFLLLPVNGDWAHKYAVKDNSITGLWQGGDFGYDLPSNFPGPTTDGTYKIQVNFATDKFSVTKQ
ncbi:MAG: SusE domain-containing protein [Bacteroidota bacterium]|nr:SusE domain-containing protein [Bacteroidota bacterium]